MYADFDRKILIEGVVFDHVPQTENEK